MKHPAFFAALLTVTLGAASAQGTTHAQPAATTASSLRDLAAGGVPVSLIAVVNGQEQVVATVNPNGTLNVTGDLSLATTVRVGSGDGAAKYTLAVKPTASGLLFVQQTSAEGRTLTLPLIAALNRDAAAARAAADADDEEEEEDDENEVDTDEADEADDAEDEADDDTEEEDEGDDGEDDEPEDEDDDESEDDEEESEDEDDD